jgi:hypothetical protein
VARPQRSEDRRHRPVEPRLLTEYGESSPDAEALGSAVYSSGSGSVLGEVTQFGLLGGIPAHRYDDDRHIGTVPADSVPGRLDRGDHGGTDRLNRGLWGTRP